MKHPLGSTLEFMPDKELRLFILTQIITPFLEQKAAEDIRLSAHVAYKAPTQIIHGPCLERKGKAAEVQVTVVCSQGPLQNLLTADIVLRPMNEAGADCPSYSLQGVIRKDDRGYYLTKFHISTLNQ